MAVAVLLMAVAMTLVPLGDAAGKTLVDRYEVAPVFVAWARFALGAVAVLPLMLARPGEFRALTDWRVLLRGAFIVAAVASILTALKTTGLATVFGAFFIGPILSYTLSAVLLREPVTPARTALLLAGFGGVLLVTRPGFGMTAGAGFAVLAGVFYGFYLTASRWLSDLSMPRGLLFAQLALGAALLAPGGIAAAPPALGPLLPWLALSGLASVAGNFLLVIAYARASATRLAPFVYFQLVAATGLGLVFFGDFPDAPALAGLGLLLVSGFASLALPRGRPRAGPG